MAVPGEGPHTQKQNFAQSFETRKEARGRDMKAQWHGNGLLCRNLSQLYIALTSSHLERQSEDNASLPAKMSRRCASARIPKKTPNQERTFPLSRWCDEGDGRFTAYPASDCLSSF